MAVPVPRPRRPLRRRLLTNAVGVALLVSAGYLTYYFVQYGNLWPYNPPVRFDYCGGHYYRVGQLSDGGGSAVVTYAQALSDANTDQLVPAFTVFPAGWRVYRTSRWRCPEPEQHGQWLFIKTGPNQYLELTDAD